MELGSLHQPDLPLRRLHFIAFKGNMESVAVAAASAANQQKRPLSSAKPLLLLPPLLYYSVTHWSQGAGGTLGVCLAAEPCLLRVSSVKLPINQRIGM